MSTEDNKPALPASLLATAPTHIYLDVGEIYETLNDGLVFKDLGDITWSEDNASTVGIRYRREDIPVDVVLHCTCCGRQHIDAPDERTPGWQNQPHRSHLCHYCKNVWRPSDLPTNGIEAPMTKGKNDGPAPEYVEGQDTIEHFVEGQWWIKELDEWSKSGTDDQKRAVAVVHNMLRCARDAVAAMTEARGCFEAAEAEGLSVALAETTDERLKDLLERRLMYAHHAIDRQLSKKGGAQ